jgi:hypothetical protein
MSTELTSAEAANAGLGRRSARRTAAGPALRIHCRGTDRLLKAEVAYRIGRDPQADIPLADPRVS